MISGLFSSTAFITYIMSKLTSDITLELKKDPTVCQLGENMYKKCRKQPHQYQYIREIMQELGKFLIEMKKIDANINTVKDCIDPTQFNKVVSGVRKVSGYENQESSFSISSIALKLGYSIRTCVDIVMSNALKEGNDQQMSKAERFIVLLKSDWSNEISSFASNTL